MGAVAVSNLKQGVQDNLRVVEADVAFAASYATGGDTLSPAALGLRQVHEVTQPSHDLITKKVVADASSRAGLSVQLGGTSSAPTLKAYDAAGTEVANASNNSARGPVRLRFLGI